MSPRAVETGTFRLGLLSLFADVNAEALKTAIRRGVASMRPGYGGGDDGHPRYDLHHVLALEVGKHLPAFVGPVAVSHLIGSWFSDDAIAEAEAKGDLYFGFASSLTDDWTERTVVDEQLFGTLAQVLEKAAGQTSIHLANVSACARLVKARLEDFGYRAEGPLAFRKDA